MSTYASILAGGPSFKILTQLSLQILLCSVNDHLWSSGKNVVLESKTSPKLFIY